MIGVDNLGVERWFDKRQTEEWSLEGDMLRVQMDEQVWKRRTASNGEPRSTVVLKDRTCMRCRRSFKAEPQMHICKSCKQSDDWQDGFTVFSCQ